MEQPLTVVLPVEAGGPDAPGRAAAMGGLDGARIGVVDNGLWRSMPTILATVSEALVGRGAAGFEVLAFDHLAPDFGDRLAELGTFAERVDGAIVCVADDLDCAVDEARMLAGLAMRRLYLVE